MNSRNIFNLLQRSLNRPTYNVHIIDSFVTHKEKSFGFRFHIYIFRFYIFFSDFQISYIFTGFRYFATVIKDNKDKRIMTE